MKYFGKLRNALRRGLLLALAAITLCGCAAADTREAYEQTAALAESRRNVEYAAEPAQAKSAQAESRSASFNGESKWDRMDSYFDFSLTTSAAPREGVIFSADMLVRSSSKPQFRGRMNVAVVLLMGKEQRWAQCAVPAQVRAINFAEPVTRDGASWYRTRFEVTFSGTVGTDVNGKWTEGIPFQQVVNQEVAGVKVYIAGTLCDYKGTIRLENPSLGYASGGGDGISVKSTVQRRDLTAVTLTGDTLSFEDGSRQTLPQVTLADPKATEAAKRTARYLAAMGSTDHVVFGHQDSAYRKAGTPASPLNSLTRSDIEDITGTPAGVIGFDGLSLAGAEFSAAQWNSGFAGQDLERVDIDALGEPAANVKALANLSNYCLSRGSLVTLSCSMPNFTQVKARDGYQAGKEPAYARYDFTSASVRDLSGNCIQSILPGGAYNAQFTAYLDMVADYASQVDGAILFRPFHEGNGGWPWWGVASSSAEDYQKAFRYTVEYLRDQKQAHNLLYVYSPNGGRDFMTEAAKRYPGDDYVDIIGYDYYQTDPAADSSEWFAAFSSGLAQIGQFAAQHGKLLAVTETGVNTSAPAPGDVVTGLPRSNCPDRQWFEKILDAVSDSGACYVLAWSNNSEMFHTPFVRAVNSDGSLYGHELLDDFLRFYNDRRSVFAGNQADAVRSLR